MQFDNWKSSSRTTESGLEINAGEEKKALLLPNVYGQAWRQILGGLRGRAPMVSAWKGQVPHEYHCPSAGPSVKEATLVKEPEPEALVPVWQGLELRDRNSGRHRHQLIQKCGYCHTEIQMFRAKRGKALSIFSTVPRQCFAWVRRANKVCEIERNQNYLAVQVS